LGLKVSVCFYPTLLGFSRVRPYTGGTINTGSTDVATGLQNLTVINAIWDLGSVFLRITMAQGSAVTCDVHVDIKPRP
jgi:hypothetical protein